MEIYIFNSLPRSGKDTCVNILSKLFEEKGLKVQKLAFKDELIKATALILNMSVEEFMEDYDKLTKEVTKFYNHLPEWYKDVKVHNLGDTRVSKREALIHVSEKVFKPMCGNNFFGEKTEKNIDLSSDIVLISDGGFVEEIQEILKWNFGEVHIVRVNKEGTTSGNDSRKLLTPDDFLVTVGLIEIDNNGTLEDLTEELKKQIVNK